MGENGLPLFIAVIIAAVILGVFVVATGIITAILLSGSPTGT